MHLFKRVSGTAIFCGRYYFACIPSVMVVREAVRELVRYSSQNTNAITWNVTTPTPESFTTSMDFRVLGTIMGKVTALWQCLSGWSKLMP